MGPALFVLSVGLAISLAAWRFAAERVTGEAETEFQHQVAQAAGTLDRSIQDNVNLLIGLRGLFAASEQIDRDEFRRYLSGFNITQHFPGARLVSFVRYVPLAEKAAFEDGVRRELGASPRGSPGFAIKPPGVRNEYMVVTYLEPLAGNERALGFDLFSDPQRRPSVERARDSGQAIASEPIWLAADPRKQISVVLRMPIYRNDMPVATVAERRAAFLGVVSSAVHVKDLVGSLLGRQLGADFDLVIHDLGFPGADGFPASPGRPEVVFDSGRPSGRNTTDGISLKQVMTLGVAGRHWRLEFSARAGPVYGIGGKLPQVILLGGLCTSLLLSWIVLMQSRARQRALELARQSTAVRAAEVLREQLVFIQELIETVPQPIFFKDAEGRYLGVNKAWEGFFGIPRERFIGKSVFELYPHDQDLARKHHAKDQELYSRPGSQSYEAAITAADARVHHTIYNKASFNRSDGSVAGLIGTITDVTGLKEAEAALRQSESRFRDLTELSSDWYWEQDAEFRFTQMSSKIYEISLDAEEHIGKKRWEMPLLGVTDEQWEAHKQLLAAHEPFQDFVYQRHDVNGTLRI
ncbi:MAG TPA: CHASE domain-containing protein, partial [Burkholderiales bacterium]|nr:CHASE domain-containing protein [Burkholderiales bacterium]